MCSLTVHHTQFARRISCRILHGRCRIVGSVSPPFGHVGSSVGPCPSRGGHGRDGRLYAREVEHPAGGRRRLHGGRFVGLSLSGTAQERPSNPYQQLKYRFIGPDGNRAAAIAGEPGNPLVTYIGAASGGIWKTTDGGINWTPIFDGESVASIGSLAVAPSAHNIVWAGTGETFIIRPDVGQGNGIYRSDDAGRTWRHVGLDKTGRIGRIVVDPRDPDVVFACALGHSFGPQPERGVYRTTDGGRTWEQVLKVDENTGCSDLAMDSHDPKTLFAGMWPLIIKTWGIQSGGTGGGVYVSHDGGATWAKIAGHGLPAADQPVGKTAVAVAPSDSRRVYALLEEKTPTLYRSDDGGESWRVVNRNHIIAERAPYYTRFAVSPDDENRLYFASVSWSVSIDGGLTMDRTQGSAGHDNHDIWIDPTNASRVLVANDEGASISLNKGKSYQGVVLPIAQMYHVFTDNQIPYYVYGNRQDGSSYRGPSNSLGGGFNPFGPSRIQLGLWQNVGGCESGFGIPDPVDHDIVWSGCYDGQLDRFNVKTGETRSVHVWPDATYGWAPADVRERWHWTFPIAISPFDHNTVYIGSQRIHRTTDGGQSFTVISPDLTLNDKSHEGSSGGLTPDNLMTWDGAVLFAIAESPVTRGEIWAGSNDGQVQLTRDGGRTWTNLTKNIGGMPPWGTISNIEPSKYDAATAYISVDLQTVGDFDPYIYKTADYGRTWTLISGGIPKSESSFVHVVREDPVRKGMLYAGTDNSVYVSWDDGGSWTPLRNNMPPAPVYWLTIQPTFNDLVVATYGRGFWILDDVTPLRAMNAQVRSAAVHLFEPRPAYRLRTVAGIHFDAGSHVEGENPPYGADIDYFLKAASGAPAEITIAGPDGQPIRTIEGPAKAGVNRVWWDLRYAREHEVKLRTSPADSPWIEVGPEGWRPLVNWSEGHIAPRVAPGRYTVRLRVAGQDVTAPLTVLKDPNASGAERDIEAQNALLLQMRGELDEVADMINHLEWTRKQIQDVVAMLGNDPKAAPVVKAARELEEKAIAAEGQLFDVRLTGQVEDSFRNPMRLYGKMLAMAGNLDKGNDLPPTDQEIAVNKLWQEDLAGIRNAVAQVTGAGTSAFNDTLKAHGYSLAIR